MPTVNRLEIPKLDNFAQADLFERMEEIYTPQWVSYRVAELGLNKLKALLARPKEVRPPCCLIYGHTNNGKTHLCRKFVEDVNPSREDYGEAVSMPVVMAQTPATPSIGSLYSSILEEVGAPLRASMSAEKKKDQVVILLRKLGTKIIILDEIHHSLTGSPNQQEQFFNALKNLSNQLHLSIVAVGTEEAHSAIRIDEQMTNRFEPYFLPKWEFGEEYVDFIIGFLVTLGFEGINEVGTPKFIRRIHTMSGGLTGETKEIICRLVEKARMEGIQEITFKMLETLDWTSPVDRRRVRR